MEGNARSSPYGLKTLVILGAVAALASCTSNGSKAVDTASTSAGGTASNGAGGTGNNGGGTQANELTSLRARIDTLEAYRARNADFVAKLSGSYSHFYYCDVTTQHKDTNKCAPMQSHVPPPTNPPK